jgi:Aromatic-ring-opening dioxygenase LigAB, LigA subunit
MSAYAINLLFYRIGREPELANRLRDDPEGVFAEFGIDEDEGKLIIARDGAGLLARGVMSIAMMHLPLAFGEDPRILFGRAPHSENGTD